MIEIIIWFLGSAFLLGILIFSLFVIKGFLIIIIVLLLDDILNTTPFSQILFFISLLFSLVVLYPFWQFCGGAETYFPELWADVEDTAYTFTYIIASPTVILGLYCVFDNFKKNKHNLKE